MLTLVAAPTPVGRHKEHRHETDEASSSRASPVFMAGGVLAGTASPVSAATYGMPTATCTSHYGYNHYSAAGEPRASGQVRPDVSYDWHHANGFHSETVAYSAA